MRECDDLLVRHGGHAMAAGVTIHPDKLDAFRTRLNEVRPARSLKREDLQPPLRLDAEVALGELTPRDLGGTWINSNRSGRGIRCVQFSPAA